MTLKKAIETSGLSEEQVKAVQRAARATWDAIGFDCLDAGGGKAIPRSHVVELVMDADHMLAYGNHGMMQRAGPLSDPAVAAFVENRPWTAERSAALKVIVTAAFEYSRYGM